MNGLTCSMGPRQRTVRFIAAPLLLLVALLPMLPLPMWARAVIAVIALILFATAATKI